MFAGKGGTGKTFDGTALAVYLSRTGLKVGLIDYDGGHSVQNTLGLKTEIPINRLYPVRENLSVVVVEEFEFINIKKAKDQGWGLSKYLDQFPKDLGIVPYADMLFEFFGVPTDLETMQKFAILVHNFHLLKNEGYTDLIIDVEPTAGLKRLLSKTEEMVKSFNNLKNKGIVFLTLLGTQWPDIKGYLQSQYIKNIEIYTERIEETVAALKAANYFLACKPEFGPITQTFTVRKIIEHFGGKMSGCIVNDVRGESHEEDFIRMLQKHDLPVLRVPRNKLIHSSRTGIDLILEDLLNTIGENILQFEELCVS